MRKMLTICLVLLLLLAGCDNEAEPTTAPVIETTTPAPTQTTVPTQPPSVIQSEVNALSYHPSGERPDVCILDEWTAAFITVEHMPGNYAEQFTRIQLWDLYTDTALREKTMEGYLSALNQTTCTGFLALADESRGQILVLDKDLNEILSFETRDTEGILSQDLSSYYYLWGDDLYRLDTGSGEEKTVTLAQELPMCALMGYDTTENVLLVTAYADPFTTGVCVAAIDLEQGDFTLLQQNATGASPAEEGILLENNDPESMHSDVSYMDWEEGVIRSLPAFMTNDGSYSTWHIAGSDYICKMTFDAIQKDEAKECQLYHLGDTVTVCSLTELLDGTKLNELCCLPGGNLLGLEVTRRGFTPYVICPEKLTFTQADTPEESQTEPVDVSVLENYRTELDGLELPENLSEARATADQLEEEFGVTILLSSQCATPVRDSGMTIVTTDQANLSDESAQVAYALEEIRKALKLYPDDFFRQFQNEAGQRGLLILLVEDFEDKRNIIGLSYGMGQWYPVAIDITSGEVFSTTCHEIWHATEIRINERDSDLLSDKKWDALNPPGYVYSYDTSENYILDVQNTFFFEFKEEKIYFVDPYGKTNPHEDRARIMEYIMASKLYARAIADIPALRLKLKVMSDAIRQTFDTEGWEQVYWERFF